MATAVEPQRKVNVPLVIGGLMLVLLLAALDQTIVALSRLARDLVSEPPRTGV